MTCFFKLAMSTFAATALIAAAPNPASPDWEFGFIKLGEKRLRPPSNVKSTRDCEKNKEVIICDMLLNDGVWYAFENHILVRKVIELPNHSLPVWLDPRDSPAQCQKRLERLMRRKFRLRVDDDGARIVENVNMIHSAKGVDYTLSVVFRRGKMSEVIESPLPWI